jgi:hypothetical protein
MHYPVLFFGGLMMLEINKELLKLLDQEKYEEIEVLSLQHSYVLRLLMRYLYQPEKDSKFWNTLIALGRVVKRLDSNKPGTALELVRRYFWSINDESGGNPWNASFAIGSIMAQCPKSCGHFNWMLSGLLDDANLREGALWGLLELAKTAPELVLPLRERIQPYLDDETANIKSLALQLDVLLPAASNT